MKILHIWNPCSVASVIARDMDKKYNTNSSVVTLKKYDKHKDTVYGVTWDMHPLFFNIKIILYAKRFDIIHVHRRDDLLPFLRKLYPKKKLIIHYHGSEIRDLWEIKHGKWSLTDHIFISTPDLLNGAPSDAELLLNPVDLTLFKPMNDVGKTGDALTFEYDANKEAKKIADRHGLKLDIYKRNVLYVNMPLLLNKYHYYIDVKRSKDILLYDEGAISLVGLQSLACGLKVINRDDEIFDILSKEHMPEYAMERVYNVYKELLS